ncbi:MFS general substrate transporter [Cryphonectria parasitica EP155]|uniref:MFS general substrate transporter n=1 Tax=Cryphonectria parasitica (strain ATCC 38755 / EP155) TaxID=660469 RepID=A0A9P4Y6C7_CRYP1|nr:MFS general substrate transporter [Cryphonectria parasitica EP155]KAF3767306.1 MFS general substrate transporter [Cryphonectria parasitica EP155]
MSSKIDDSPRAEHIQDQDLSGDENVDLETTEHLQRLTPDELAVEKKLRKKIDFRIMPLTVLIYLMNYIDRNNYAAARLQGLQDDLGMTDNQYQIGLSTLFVGYVLMQVPSNALLNYVGRPSIYIGFFTTIWGLVSALTSQVQSPGGIIAARFVLGFVEAPFFAGILFYLSKWYTKEELSLRMAIFYSGSLVSGAFGNLIAAGILNGLAGKRGYAAWQWLYIMEGSITIFFGLLLMLVLPDFPDTWNSLSDEERRVANRRLAIEAAEADIDEKHGMSHLRGIKLALQDPKTYLLAVAYHGQTGAAGIQNYFPTLTETVTPNHIDALLLCAPPYLFMVIWSFAHSRVSDHLKKRFWFFVYPIPVTIVGFILFMTTSSFGARYFSLFLQVFVFAMNGTLYAWISSSIPRPPAKRAAAFAFINSVGNAASIWTPFTYREQDAPYYRPALGVCIGLQCIAFACALALRVLLQQQNKSLARMEDAGAQLTENDTRKLQLTAEVEGISVEEARSLQRGFRYLI